MTQLDEQQPGNQVAPAENATIETEPETGDEIKTEKFGSKAEYWLACIGYAVGFGNVWRFPYKCYINGGAAFLIPYLITLIFVAIPMFMLETAFGQLVDCKLKNRFSIIHPGLWPVIALQAIICAVSSAYYITLMAWSFSFLLESFSWDLPWLVKGAAESKTKVAKNLWNSEYFYKETL
jgi:solute carrier family 6 GABA transporter-like protein 1